jgi:hypothetical protein
MSVPSQHSLFRPEAVDFQRHNQLWGQVALLQAIITWFIVAAGALLFSVSQTICPKGIICPKGNSRWLFDANVLDRADIDAYGEMIRLQADILLRADIENRSLMTSVLDPLLSVTL